MGGQGPVEMVGGRGCEQCAFCGRSMRYGRSAPFEPKNVTSVSDIGPVVNEGACGQHLQLSLRRLVGFVGRSWLLDQPAGELFAGQVAAMARV
ncbi:hypothetical protein XHV734_4006 [Xanthomonas hortorum pv. vitians]|nr:hypothetical protein XHV734_4006 [Xanthomonas hortorum pv. vitians]